MRAKLNYRPGYIWHITNRCHHGEFLLESAEERENVLHWLFEARKRNKINLLGYMVTRDHIHLLAAEEKINEIARAMHLINGRVGQEYNLKHNRRGSFWAGRYHATAIESLEFLRGCLLYVDLHMVRAGVVKHPRDWISCGYHEIIDPRQRYRIIDHDTLAQLFGISDRDQLSASYSQWIEDALRDKQHLQRDPQWTRSRAVGSRQFVQEFYKAPIKRIPTKESAQKNETRSKGRQGAADKPGKLLILPQKSG